MSHQTLLASVLAAVLAGSVTLAMAQDRPAPPPAPAPHGMAMHGPATHGGDRHAMRMDRFDFAGPRNSVIGDLHGLERLYILSGRSKDLAALYNEVLAKSQDPRVRDYAYRHLARLQARPANVDQAIATLRKGLDESLANEAKMHAEREKLRVAWMQRHAEAAKPAAGQ
ncbi:MAG: hypothetical protein KGJ97_02715 [Xanthomonadaceae bacterium]|nr:hypothetical protein [Xanthomonadaceae bacterium]MDE3072568.1 hypothetical protein [Pseudomonadota bacterium]